MMGIGVILALRGLLPSQGRSSDNTGFMIGGGVLVLIGAGITYNIQDWWAFLLIGLGLVVILRGMSERGRNPMP